MTQRLTYKLRWFYVMRRLNQSLHGYFAHEDLKIDMGLILDTKLSPYKLKQRWFTLLRYLYQACPVEVNSKIQYALVEAIDDACDMKLRAYRVYKSDDKNLTKTESRVVKILRLINEEPQHGFRHFLDIDREERTYTTVETVTRYAQIKKDIENIFINNTF